MRDLSFLSPDWPAPNSIKAVVTRRSGGVSERPFDSLNLAMHVGDRKPAVEANRAQLQNNLNFDSACWMNQVHGTEIVEASRAMDTPPDADACWTAKANVACVVMTADCLPVLACSTSGAKVIAMHAGWRGLAAGILPKGLASAGLEPEDSLIWLGPAIGPESYQVGQDLVDAFNSSSCFAGIDLSSAFAPDGEAHYLCNLYRLARLQLAKQGFHRVYGGDQCTFKQDDAFFSYRRDGQTGRMASLIWITD